jgi:hypothetical protein
MIEGIACPGERPRRPGYHHVRRVIRSETDPIGQVRKDLGRAGSDAAWVREGKRHRRLRRATPVRAMRDLKAVGRCFMSRFDNVVAEKNEYEYN